jgi:hypothetical protein
MFLLLERPNMTFWLAVKSQTVVVAVLPPVIITSLTICTSTTHAAKYHLPHPLKWGRFNSACPTYGPYRHEETLVLAACPAAMEILSCCPCNGGTVHVPSFPQLSMHAFVHCLLPPLLFIGWPYLTPVIARCTVKLGPKSVRS